VNIIGRVDCRRGRGGAAGNSGLADRTTFKRPLGGGEAKRAGADANGAGNGVPRVQSAEMAEIR